jgi:hypothetical protein
VRQVTHRRAHSANAWRSDLKKAPRIELGARLEPRLPKFARQESENEVARQPRPAGTPAKTRYLQSIQRPSGKEQFTERPRHRLSLAKAARTDQVRRFAAVVVNREATSFHVHRYFLPAAYPGNNIGQPSTARPQSNFPDGLAAVLCSKAPSGANANSPHFAVARFRVGRIPALRLHANREPSLQSHPLECGVCSDTGQRNSNPSGGLEIGACASTI